MVDESLASVAGTTRCCPATVAAESATATPFCPESGMRPGTHVSSRATRATCVALCLAAVLASTSSAQDLYNDRVVRTLDLTFKQSNWWQLLAQNYVSKTYIRADLKVDGQTFKDVGVRFRGNSSYRAIGTSQKKPFKIKLDEFVPGQELYGYSTLNLNNSFRDATFTREIVSYWLMRKIIPAPKACFAKLTLNGQNWGPYLHIQQINKDLLREWFEDRDGNRYRGERQPGAGRDDSALTWLGTDPNAYKRGYELKNSAAFKPWEDIRDLCRALNTTTAAQLPVELPKFLDVDEAWRYLAVNNLLPAIDSYIGNVAHNYYLIKDNWHNRFSLLPWDLNASFGGNAWLTVNQKINLSPFYFINHSGRPLIRRGLNHGPWRQRYLAYFRALLDDGYDWKQIGPYVARLQKLIEPELRKDTKKLYSMTDFAANVTRTISLRIGNRWQQIPGLKPMVDGRSAFLRRHAEVGLPTTSVTQLAHTPKKPTLRDRVTVTARVTSSAGIGTVTLYTRVRGRWLPQAMFDDGKHGDGAAKDGVYGAFVAPQGYGAKVEYFVEAATPITRGAAQTLAPRTGGHRPASWRVDYPRKATPLVFNELLTNNRSGIRDPRGDREDWFELHNPTSSPISIGGHYLTDDFKQPTRWRVPANVTIPAKGFVLFWADNEPQEGPMHTNFRLSSSGEELALFAPDGQTLMTEIVWGQQAADISLARLFDASPSWVGIIAPTPGKTNALQRCGVRAYVGPLPGQHPLRFGSSIPVVGRQIGWLYSHAQPNGVVISAFSAGGTSVQVPGLGFSLLTTLPWVGVVTAKVDALGKAQITWTIPNDSRLAGVRFYSPSYSLGLKGLTAGDAIEFTICR